MHTTLLNNFSRISSEISPSLLQSQVDGLVGGFAQQATDWRSLAAMTVGGLAYRLGRIGTVTVGAGGLASAALGLGAEVTAFEMTNRSLSSLTGERRLSPNLWRWEGNGGIRQGLFSSLITFGSLKGAGRLAQGENIVVQHLLQDAGMVLGHQVSGFFGITPRPAGSLMEQFLHAESTNLQLGAGMALGHGLTQGRIHALERGLDLSVQTTEGGARFQRPDRGTSPLRFQPALLGPVLPSPEPTWDKDPKREGIFLSSSLEEPPGGGGGRAGIDELGIGPETPLERKLRDGLIVSSESLGTAIWHMLEEIPSGPRPTEVETGEEMFPPQLILEGRLRYRRLETLHRLLSGGKDPKEIHVVDNGPGHMMDVAVTLARLGSTVMVKEPGDREFEFNRDIIESLNSLEIEGRIALTPADEIDLPTPSDVVYWTNPCFARLEYPPEIPLGTYLGRDVKPGGYLVLQSDHLFENDVQKELLQLDMDPREWELIFDGRLKNSFPGSNYVLPTMQTHNLHLQVYRRKLNPSVPVSPDVLPGNTFPYFQGKNGRYLLPSSPMTIAVLGDVYGARLYSLASQGHNVIQIDRSIHSVNDAWEMVEIMKTSAEERGDPPFKGSITYLLKDWYDSPLEADLVEAFYPLDFRDAPPLRDPARLPFLKDFIHSALNSKLGPKGRGVFVISEHSEIISDMAEVIEQDPTLELLEEIYQQRWVPIMGGYGHLPFDQFSPVRHSWLFYRRKPSK